MVWLVKGIEGPPLSILWAFCKQRVAMALQKAQASSILEWVIVFGEAFSRVNVLSRFLLLFLSGLFNATNKGLDLGLGFGFGHVFFSSLSFFGVVSLVLDFGPLFVFHLFPFGLPF